MISGAFAGFVAAEADGDLWLGLLAGAVVGLLVSMVMVLFCVRLGMDQIIVGIAIVLTAEGATSVLHGVMFGESYPRLDAVATFEIPLLRDIPVLGGSVFSQPLAVYLGLVAVGVVSWMLRSTSWGLHVRAAGERPASLDAAGVSVVRVRTLAEIDLWRARRTRWCLSLDRELRDVRAVRDARHWLHRHRHRDARARPSLVVHPGRTAVRDVAVADHGAAAGGHRHPDRRGHDAAVHLRDGRAHPVRSGRAPAVRARAAIRAWKSLMRLTDEFTISTPPDRAFAMLLDLERVAPCVPGGEIDPPDGEGVYPGRVSVKLGPMKFVYAGRVRLAEQDPVRRTAVIEGEGRASGGADTAKVRSVMEVVPEGDGSRVRITTDLDIKGRAAQMGQGVIVDVSRRLVSQAAGCIEARLGAADDATIESLPTVGPVGGISLVASVFGSRVRGLASDRGGRGSTADHGPVEEGHDGPPQGADDGTR